LGLADEPFSGFRRLRKFERQQLQSDRTLKLCVFSLEDNTHAAPADFAADPIFIREERSLLERLGRRDERFCKSDEIPPFRAKRSRAVAAKPRGLKIVRMTPGAFHAGSALIPAS
jgi:hypothetical protein